MEEIADCTVHKGYSLAAVAELPAGFNAIETKHEVAPGWFNEDSKYEPCVCLWDTGSTYCGISDILVDKWNLPSVGDATMRIGDDCIITAPGYMVTIRLSDGSEHAIVATRQHLTNVDVLIGLSLITEGLFTLIPTVNHGSIFTFEIPNTKNDLNKYLKETM